MTEKKDVTRGRPVIIFDWKLLDKTLARAGKMSDCVYMLGVSASTIERRIREEYDMTFNEYRDLQLTDLRLRIFDKQVEVALAGSETLLKHLGENLLGQSQKNQNLNIGVSIEDYLRQLNGGADGEN